MNLNFSIAYKDGGIGSQRCLTMKEVINVVKQLKDRKQVKGIAIFNDAEYKETIPIGGLV